MKLRIAVAAAMIICGMALIMCGCAKDVATDAGMYDEPAGEAGMRRTVLYYKDDDGFIVPVMKLIPWEEGIGRAAIGNLVDTAENRAEARSRGLNATIPDGVEYTLRIRDGVATIDISSLSAFADEASERAMVTSIVNSLAEFPTIDAVTITLNGEKVTKLPCETKLSEAMTPFMLNAEDGDVSASADGMEPMTLYFANNAASLNVPVTRYCAGHGLAAAVEQLIAGPEDAALMNSFPEGTRLISADIYGGTATVNLSGEFLSAQYTEGMAETAFDTLFLTANAIEDISELNVLVEGKECELTRECTAPVYANTFQ